MNGNQIVKQDDEHGSALLLCLGILSLVLILAMSFAYSANTRLGIARTQGAIVNARAMADDVIQLTMTDIKYMLDIAKTSSNDCVYAPATIKKISSLQNVFQVKPLKISDAEVQNYIASTNLELSTHDESEHKEIGCLFNLIDSENEWLTYPNVRQKCKMLPQLALLSQDTDFQNSLNFAPPVTITYTLKDGTDEKTIDTVIGRYAYLILDDSGKINVNDTISLQKGLLPWTLDHSDHSNNLSGGKFCDRLAPYNEDIASGETGYSTYQFNIFNASFNSITPTPETYSENQTGRFGLLMEELQSDTDYINQLFGTDTLAGWLSYSHLVDSVGIKYLSASIPTNFNDDDSFAYTFFGGEDIEAYWDADEDIEIARFDLSGASWLYPSGSLSEDLNDDTKTGWKSSADNVESCKLVKRLCGYSSETGSLDNDPNCGKMEFWADAPTLADWNRREKLDTPCYPNYFNDNKFANATTPVGYIDWLHRMVDEDGIKIGFHVAANLKDYCDQDSHATFKGTLFPELDDESLKFKEPEFCGNERVAYINEVLVRAATKTSNVADHINYDLYLYAGIEMLNIFCNDDMTTAECTDVPVGKVISRIIGKVDVYRQQYQKKIVGGVWDGSSYDIVPNSFEKLSSFSMSTSDGGGYVELSSADKWYKWGENTDSSGNIPAGHLGYNSFCLEKKLFIPDSLKSDFESQKPVAEEKHYRYCFRFIVDDVSVFTRDTASGDDVDMLYDMVSLPNDISHSDNENPPDDVEFRASKDAVYNDPALRDIVDFQAMDARCNHRQLKNVMWVVRMGSSSSPQNNTMQADNMDKDDKPLKEYTFADSYSASDSKDFEDEVTFEGTNMVTYSTSFIRNAPMRSLWELGAIHRAYPNQTINLKKFTRKTGSDSASYSDGDAQILDQVKIGPLMFVKGKFNVNNCNPAAWKKLLKDIDYSWYDDSTSVPTQHNTENNNPNTEYKYDDGAPLLDASRWDSGDKEDYFHRGRISNILIQGTNPIVIAQNDRDLESWVGKTAQLLTTRLEAYSMLVAVETLKEFTEITSDTEYNLLKDTLTNPVKVMKSDSDTRYCSVTGRQKVLVHFIRDAWTNEFKIMKKQYLEE